MSTPDNKEKEPVQQASPEVQHSGAESNGEQPRKEMSRRNAVQLLAGLPVAAMLSWPSAEHEKVSQYITNALRAAAEGAAYAPKFFTAAEWKTVRVLSDMVIPRDERSGGAVD
ncbi:MAG TPA: hypothetical protein VIG78_05720, partial [Gemmatimonadaceae bacterium]